MARSKHTAAHFTFVEECDVSALKDLRARLRPAADAQGVKLTFLPFIVKAVVAALKKHPSLNSAFDESTQELVQRRYYNIGIASSTPSGLMVPVVKDADRKSILDVARDIARLGDATKEGKVKVEDPRRLHVHDHLAGRAGRALRDADPELPGGRHPRDPPDEAEAGRKDGQIVIGEVMLLSLSFDHRIIDGHVGAAFAYEIIGFLENPDRLFLEMA